MPFAKASEMLCALTIPIDCEWWLRAPGQKQANAIWKASETPLPLTISLYSQECFGIPDQMKYIQARRPQERP